MQRCPFVQSTRKNIGRGMCPSTFSAQGMMITHGIFAFHGHCVVCILAVDDVFVYHHKQDDSVYLHRHEDSVNPYRQDVLCIFTDKMTLCILTDKMTLCIFTDKICVSSQTI
jgi:hypothetical protein